MTTFKTIIILIALVILGGVIYLAWDFRPETDQGPAREITNFEDCAAAGYPILESYPEQCRTPAGQMFTRDSSNESATSDLIRVNSPRPGENVKSPLEIFGLARGGWFFEANFPVAIYDATGAEIGRHFAEANGDWMTIDFVPFKAIIEFGLPKTRTGILVLEKANPSGQPEQTASLTIPIEFEKFEAETKPSDPRVSGGCVITGCSNQVCSDREVATTCQYSPVYACYQNAKCGRDAVTGQCQWQETSVLLACLAETRQIGDQDGD